MVEMKGQSGYIQPHLQGAANGMVIDRAEICQGLSGSMLALGAEGCVESSVSISAGKVRKCKQAECDI